MYQPDPRILRTAILRSQHSQAERENLYRNISLYLPAGEKYIPQQSHNIGDNPAIMTAVNLAVHDAGCENPVRKAALDALEFILNSKAYPEQVRGHMAVSAARKISSRLGRGGSASVEDATSEDIMARIAVLNVVAQVNKSAAAEIIKTLNKWDKIQSGEFKEHNMPQGIFTPEVAEAIRATRQAITGKHPDLGQTAIESTPELIAQRLAADSAAVHGHAAAIKGNPRPGATKRV